MLWSWIRTIAAAAVVAVCGVPHALAQGGAKTLAEYPAGTFLENLAVLLGDRLVYTSYFGKAIEILEPGKPARTLATLSAHPVSILPTPTGYIVAAHGQAFTSGQGFVETQMILLLDRNGREVRSFKVPQARFLNGMVPHRRGTVLIADSIAGTIWQFDPRAGTATQWLADPALARGQDSGPFRPGANGLKWQSRRLIVSNSSRGTLSAITVGIAGKPAGKVETLATVGPIDDFAIGSAGEIVFATHSDALRRRAADGTVTALLENGCDGCTAVAILGRGAGRTVAVLTTGGMLEGRKLPAKVLSVPYPVPQRR